MPRQSTARNPKIASKTLKRSRPKAVPFEEDATDAKDAKQSAQLEAKVDKKKALTTIPEILAESKFHYKNWLWDQDKTHFPFHPRMRHVDLYYPEAQGGPLLIDFPMKEDHAKELQKAKQPIILKAGFRYICLSQNMSIEEAQETLGRIDFKRQAKKKKGKKNELDDTARSQRRFEKLSQ